MNKVPGILRQTSHLLSAFVALLIVSCALSVSQPAPATAATTFDVLTFGALPNDTLDDTAAIQAAINAASHAGGGTVAFPSGTFRVTSWLYPAGNVSIVGIPGETILFMPAQPTGCFFFYGYELENTSIEGLTLRANSNTDNVSGIAMHGAVNCRVQNMRFENLDYGMKLGSGPVASGWLIENPDGAQL